MAAGLAAIPTLAPLAEPVSWASALASGAASALGFSKPSDEGPVMRTNNAISLAHMMNVDGYDGSVKLALLSSAKVQTPSTVLGTSEDDMSFRRLFKIFTFVDSFTWDPTMAAGTVLENFDLCPLSFDTTILDTSVTYTVAPPFVALSNMFKYWRGSVRFKLKCVKTKFHSGRLSLVFFPGLLTADSPSISDAAWAHRLIWDVSSTNEIEFSCPYTFNTDYLQRTVAYGLFQIYVDTPMVVPSGVYAGATILVEMCMDDDAELAIPIPQTMTAIVPSTVTPTTMVRHDVDYKKKEPITFSPIKQQMADGIRPQAGSKEVDLGGAKTTGSKVDIAAMCIGEKIESLRSLIKRFYRVRVTLGAGTNYVFRHFATVPANSTGAAIQLTDLGLDLYSLVGMMYAYAYGSVRMKCFTGSTSPNNTNYYLTNVGTTATTATFVAGTYTLYFTGSFFGDPTMTHPGELECPAYHKMPLRLVRPSYTGHLEPIDFYSVSMFLRQQSTLNTNTATQFYWRACGDDGGFSYFLGMPPYVLETSLPMEDPGAPERDLSFPRALPPLRGAELRIGAN